MLDHLGIPCADPEAALRFYLTAFAPLGFREAARFGTPAGPVIGVAGADGVPHFWLAPHGGRTDGEVHLAFTAPDRAAVDAVHAAAVAAGFEVLHAPRVWPEYHPGYYGTFLRDPDGNNAEAVHHSVG
ncbi:VOC family protein [Klenkia taihuensis]|uniref:Predicted lactoylglutathione lyase n=1 Tax=Klenkia taihuensis TaxID=1225127 RepID=A0A1I1I1U0_9ACTN|nr:VOC family protein [Klenkia taihuensis]GHE08874.1 putative glyoxalase/bleomycin resistance protein [Klenkia taihuensis]SFC30409.1 Predicted lactoylglutathione lyase [Klenkia taihuensis]